MTFGGILLSYETLLVAAAALLLERLIGYLPALRQAIGHPADWMAALLSAIGARLDRGAGADGDPAALRLRGGVALGLACVLVLAVTVPLSLLLRALPLGWALEALIASPMLSQRALRGQVEAVADGLHGSLGHGRAALACLLGRDASRLDESGIAAGALDRLADAMPASVTAPLLYMAIAGLPGAALYRTVVIAGAMASGPWRGADFGLAAKRAGDAATLPAAWLSGLLLVAAAGVGSLAAGERAWMAMRREATRHVPTPARRSRAHRSKVHWSEPAPLAKAALAGALDIVLAAPSGPGTRSAIGDGRADLRASDIRRGVNLYDQASALLLGLMALLLIIPWLFR